MLLNMYRGWCDKHDCLMTEADGVMTIEGENLDGLEQEHGIHMLVRISPHDPQRRRHTSRCKVLIGDMSDMGWLTAIRTYVLSPYQSVTNKVTGKQTGDVRLVFKGCPDWWWGALAF